MQNEFGNPTRFTRHLTDFLESMNRRDLAGRVRANEFVAIEMEHSQYGWNSTDIAKVAKEIIRIDRRAKNCKDMVTKVDFAEVPWYGPIWDAFLDGPVAREVERNPEVQFLSANIKSFIDWRSRRVQVALQRTPNGPVTHWDMAFDGIGYQTEVA